MSSGDRVKEICRNKVLQQIKPNRSRNVRWLLIAVAVMLVVLLGLLISTILNESALQSNGVTIIATVTDSQISEKTGRYQSGYSYDIRYSFQVNGAVYTYSDATGRRNLWSSIPESVWNEATATNQIQVIYQPDNPWNNRPTINNPDMAAFIVLGIILVAILVPLFIAIRRQFT